VFSGEEKPLPEPPESEEEAALPKIRVSMAHEEMGAALAYGITPEAWYEMPRWSRCAAVAYLRCQRKISRWREIWSKTEK